ncbi:NADP-dependent oxidoreductase [Actinomadura sp. B10D3]|uniref:NADP-dependent oxidoreductase n=1 Tax=Actinomadura sp. B10D3 TaxID=3153557 RepID=UPI00325D1EF5
MVFGGFGPPEVLDIVELAVPDPGPGQVRVRVLAGGVQPFDTAVRRGVMGVPVSFPQQIGNEFAGVVDQVGAGVDAWSEGDEVFGWSHMSSLAEYAVAGVDAIVGKPAGMPWEVAGCLSASGQTALTALRELGVGSGDTVLVHAAAGGAGTMAVQIARAYGAEVIGTAGEANHEYLIELGATPITYGDGLVDRVRAAAPNGVDAVLDAVGGQALRDSLALVRDRSRIGTLVDHDLAVELGVRGIRARRAAEQLQQLVTLYDRGMLRVHIRATYPLEAVADAHREVETGHGRGKVVVTLDGGRYPAHPSPVTT